MGKVSGSLSPAPLVTVKIVFTIYNTLTPTVEAAARIVKDPPHNTAFTFQWSNLVDGVYIVKVNQSVDGIALGPIMHDFWVSSVTNTVVFARKFYTVGGANPEDPAPNQTMLSDPFLNGKTVIGFFKEGFRYLKENVEWIPVAGGGVQLQGIHTFYDTGEVATVEYTTPVATSVAASPAALSDIIFLVSDTSLSATHYNKTLFVTPDANTNKITFPFLSTIPDATVFLLHHDRGLAPNVEATASGAELFRFRGQDKTAIHLGIGEWIRIVKKGSRFYVTDFHGQWDRVGERIGCDENDRDNMLYAGQPGVTFDGNVYKRIYDYILNELPAPLKVTMADYNVTFVAPSPDGGTYYLNRGKYAIDTIAKTFKLPDMTGKSLKFESSAAGSYQHDNVGPHEHNLLKLTSAQHSASSSPVDGNANVLVNAGGTISAVSGTTMNGAKISDVIPRAPNAVRAVLQYPVILI